MEKSRPLRITWILRSADLSGGSRVVRKLAEQLGALGHHCTVAFLSESSNRPSPRYVRSFARSLLRQWRVRGTQPHHFVKAPFETIEVRGPRVEAHHVPDADIAIGTWWETMEWIDGWPSEKGAPVYFIQHHELFGGESRRVQATYRLPVLKLTVASWLRDLMRDRYGDPHAVLIPNGIDLKQFHAPARERSDPPTVGVVASPTRWKRTDVAFEAIRMAQARVPGLRALAFGSEPLARHLLPPRRLEYLLRPAQHELAGLYSRCDVWLLASDSEGFGLPGLEASACRCPVIATRSGGPLDYLRDGISGYLVPTGDAPAMARRILDLVTSKAEAWRQMSDAAFAVAQRFSWPRSAYLHERTLLRYLDSPESRIPHVSAFGYDEMF